MDTHPRVLPPASTHPLHDEQPRTYIRIPKPNWQVVALLIVAFIAAVQTIQLLQLKKNSTAQAATAASPAATSAPAASSSSAASTLPSQVGGC